MRRLAPGIALMAALAWVYRHLFRGELLAGRDVLRLAYPDAHFLRETLLSGELPLWIPNVFLGQPFAATLQAQAFYPPRIALALALGPYWGISLLQVFHAGIAVAGGYAASRALKGSPLASALAGATFGLSPLFTELSGTPNLVSAAAWSGFILAAAVRGRVRSLALWVALSALAGAPELLLAQGLIAAVVAFGVSRETLGKTLVGGAWGAALSALVWIPALEFAAQSSRSQGRGSALDWSASWRQLAALFWPNADLPRGAYWGEDQWLLLALFVGTSTAVLAVAGVRRANRASVALVALFALLALLSLGRHFAPAEWLLSMPGLRAFRYPVKALIGAALCLSLLAGMGLDRLRERTSPLPALQVVLGAMGIGVGAMVMALLLERFSAGGAWFAVVAISVWLVAAAWPAAANRGARVGVTLAVLAALEVVVFHVRFVGTSLAGFDSLARPAPWAQLARGGRVSIDFRPAVPPAPNEPPGEVEVTRGLDAVAEASRAFGVPNRFVEDGLLALEGYGAPEPPRIQEFHLARRRAIYDLTGVRWFVRADGKPFEDLTLLQGDEESAAISRSDTALPRAFIVHRARAASQAEVLDAIERGEAATTALLSEGADLGPTDDCAGSRAEVVAAGANRVEVSVDACGRGYLILSDSYFPGWTARVDGEEVEVLRADHALRAVAVAGGKHSVVFAYQPWTFRLGAAIALLAAIAWTVVGLRRRFRAPPLHSG